MGKPWRHILIISAIAVLFTLVVFLIFYPVPTPPAAEMKDARDAISLARKNRADIYAGELYTGALVSYDSAMANWRRENEIFLYKRNYSKVIALAGLAEKNAIEASEKSLNNTSNLRVILEKELEDLNDLLKEINKIFPTYPLTAEIRNKISIGKMLIRESEIAYRDGDFLQAEKKISESRALLESSYEYANSHLRSYFKSFPRWQIWVDSTIAFQSKVTIIQL